MIKNNLMLICFVFISFSVFSQELALYNQYLLNPYLLNPAVTGSYKYPVVVLTDRHQWLGIENAPQTQAISSATRLGDYEGFGVVIYKDKNGAMNKVGIHITYAHHLVLNIKKKLKLSFGCSFVGYQLSIDHTMLEDLEVSDPLIFESQKSIYVPDAVAGTYIYSPKYFVGLSVANMLESKINFDDNNDSYDHNRRTIFLSGGYNFDFESVFAYEPSLLLRSTTQGLWQVDVNGRFTYQKNYWIGYSFRTNGSIMFLTGVKFGKFRFAYGYEHNNNELRSYSNGNHEFMLSYSIGDRDRENYCPAYY